MSVRVLARVWDGYPGGGSELLTLLALADWSDDDGHCFPSIQKIAEKGPTEGAAGATCCAQPHC